MFNNIPMINDEEYPPGSTSQLDDEQSTNLRNQRQQPHYSSSCSSLTSGIGQSDHSIGNDKTSSINITDSDVEHSSTKSPVDETVPLQNINSQMKNDIKKFVDSIFTDSQSISLRKKAEFGQLVRLPEARLLFAMFVDDYRVNSKRVNELTFYSLAQHFSIVLLECLLAEDFRPAKIIMNMMFTYYHEQNCAKIPPRDRPLDMDGKQSDSKSTIKIYLYTLLKDQQIFKSIRFWTSAFYESVIIERNNHSVFVDRGQGKISSERRNEELDCGKNITFGLLGSFIYNMSLLDLSHEFCQEFLDKHSTIAGLSDEQLQMLRENLKTMFNEAPNSSAISPTSSASEKLATFLQKLGTRINSSSQSQ